MRPLLLVDVDGVLNPEFDADTRKRLAGYGGWLDTYGHQGERRFPLFLNPAHGLMLRQCAQQTGAELAWATTWNDKANEFVRPRLDLTWLPVAPAKRFSKAETVVPWTKGRPFVWLDDEAYVAEDCARLATQPHLVITVDPAIGLTFDHLDEARAWLTMHNQRRMSWA